MSEVLGKRIKELRTLSNMSQEELGRRVGVQRAAINKYEKGTVSNIPLTTVEQIAYVFEVSPAYLVGWEDKPPNHLSLEVRVIQAVSRLFGSDVVDLMETYMGMNRMGQRKLQNYAEDIWKLYNEKE